MKNNQFENQFEFQNGNQFGNQNEKMNIGCRIFIEQVELILKMPENERKEFLWALIINAYNIYKNQNENQIENQNENQIECANVSVSVSVLNDFNKLIFNTMQKTVRFKKFSSNYGGTRKNAGRRPKSENTESQKLYGEYNNVCITEEQYNKLLGVCASKELLNELINSFSVNIEVGKERPYKAELPNAHYERLKAYYNFRKKYPDKFKENQSGASPVIEEWYTKQKEKLAKRGIF